MVSVPRFDLIGSNALYQTDRLRLIVDLNRDITGQSPRYVIKRRRESADASALVDTGASKGTLTVTDAGNGLLEIVVEKPESEELIGRLQHELFVVASDQVLTEWHGTVEFLRRVTSGA